MGVGGGQGQDAEQGVLVGEGEGQAGVGRVGEAGAGGGGRCGGSQQGVVMGGVLEVAAGGAGGVAAVADEGVVVMDRRLGLEMVSGGRGRRGGEAEADVRRVGEVAGQVEEGVELVGERFPGAIGAAEEGLR